MKNVLPMLMGIILSHATFANDTGMPSITVEDIKITTTDKENIRREVPEGTSVLAEIHGPSASKLMHILPSINAVGGMNKSYRRNMKLLDIIGKNQGYVSIECRGGEEISSKSDQIIIRPFKGGPKCTVLIFQQKNDGENAFPQYQEFVPTQECK